MSVSRWKSHSVTAAILCLALIKPGIAQSQTAGAAVAPDRTTRTVATAHDGIRASEAQLLQPDEVESLSKRNQEPGPEVRGGSLSNEHLTYIVIALAAAILVLVLK